MINERGLVYMVIERERVKQGNLTCLVGEVK